MIESILIDNFAIIKQLNIDFDDSMTVLTGETGAGKSIIIDAIGQLLGQRVQSSFVGKFKDKAFIEGVFDITNNAIVKTILSNNNFEIEDDKLIVSKSFNKDGKSIIKLNYRNTTQSFLKSVMENVIDIHSQFQTHSLFDPENHLSILDSLIGKEVDVLLDSYTMEYEAYVSLKKQYKTLLNDELNDEQISFYQAQLDEINELDFSDFDENALEEERQKLSSFQKINEKVTHFRQYMDNSSSGVIAMMQLALKQLSDITDIEEYRESYDKLYDLYYQVNDVNEQIYNDFNNLYYDEYRMQEIQNTISLLQRLKRKHGQSVEAILETRDTLISKIEVYNNRELVIENLSLKIQESRDKINLIAKNISDCRKKFATTFKDKMIIELQDMYLPNVDFYIDFKETTPTKYGIDKIIFMISTNTGYDAKPLHKVSSGGELSRIMLAIKILSMKQMAISTIIFDEADSGVSGKVAQSIGKKMALLASDKQVFCITHLAQVASFARHHYHVMKINNEESVDVKIELLDTQSSIEELAKMISGEIVSNESLNHAATLKRQNQI